MSADENKKDEAAEKAKLAGKQIKHAASNAEDAVEAAAEYTKDEVVDRAEKAKEFAEKLIVSEYGQATLALGLGVVSIVIGTKKVVNARRMQRNFRTDFGKADRHIRPEN